MMGRAMRRGLVALIVLAALGLCINFYVIACGNSRIVRDGDYSGLSDVDCVIVLGAGIWGDEPSPVLADRLAKGLELYEAGVAPKIIMSGDHGQTDYDEVNLMKSYAMERGVPSEDVFMDHAGFSTYDSMYRAQGIFCVERALVVTQGYHLSRALFIGKALGIDVYGAAADQETFSLQKNREVREIIARDKDLIKSFIKPEAHIMGDQLPIK